MNDTCTRDARAHAPKRSSRASARGRGARALSGVVLTAAANLGLLWVLARIAEPAVAPPVEVPVQKLTRADAPPPPPPEEAPPSEVVEPTTPALPAAPAVLALNLSPHLSADPLPLPPLDVAVEALDLRLLTLPRVQAAARTGGAQPGDGGPRLEFAPDLEDFYPRTARTRKVEGRSRLRLRLDATGQVVEAVLLQSTPPGVFDEAAERAARHLRYAPAMRGGAPAAAAIEVTLVWKLR